MPTKSIVTLSELVLLLLVWAACQNAWKFVIIEGLNRAVQSSFPNIHRYYQTFVVGSMLIVVVYAIILLTKNVTIGRYKVFELDDTQIVIDKQYSNLVVPFLRVIGIQM